MGCTIQLAVCSSTEAVVLSLPLASVSNEGERRVLLPRWVYSQHFSRVPGSAIKLPIRSCSYPHIPSFADHALTCDEGELTAVRRIQIDDQDAGTRERCAVQLPIRGKADAHVTCARTLDVTHRLCPRVDHQNFVALEWATAELTRRGEANVGILVLSTTEPVDEGKRSLSQSSPWIYHQHAASAGRCAIEPAVGTSANAQVLFRPSQPRMVYETKLLGFGVEDSNTIRLVRAIVQLVVRPQANPRILSALQFRQ
mmetsp:Transcript_61078/g.175248  ORF Transcript_61078/g.175248 Transcript_61078/m.175248 type:complete len:255 (-) Transcript_61078:249-1013(-)